MKRNLKIGLFFTSSAVTKTNIPPAGINPAVCFNLLHQLIL